MAVAQGHCKRILRARIAQPKGTHHEIYRPIYFCAYPRLPAKATSPSKKDQMTALTAIENGALLVDVRSAKEVSTGSFDNAINIPHTDIVAGLEKLGVDKKSNHCRLLPHWQSVRTSQGCAGGSGLPRGDQWRGLQRPASR